MTKWTVTEARKQSTITKTRIQDDLRFYDAIETAIKETDHKIDDSVSNGMMNCCVYSFNKLHVNSEDDVPLEMKEIYKENQFHERIAKHLLTHYALAGFCAGFSIRYETKDSSVHHLLLNWEDYTK